MSGAGDGLAHARFEGARQPLVRATTLPREAFVSPAIYAQECERLFRREWLCVARVDQVPAPGDHLPIDLLDEALVLVRGADDRVRVLSRVCRHRAATLVEAAGNAKSFQCPYHHWTYGLDGRLIGAPHMEGAEGFSRERCGLPETRSEVWEGFVFVNLDGEAEALGPRLAPLSKQLEGYGIADRVAQKTASYDSRFNWKVLSDNFMEAYHHIATHRDTLEPVFPATKSYTTGNEGPYSVLVMPAREEGAAPLIAASVFPFHLFAPSEHSMAWYRLLPHEVGHFTLEIYNCFPKAMLDDPAQRDAVAAMHAIGKIVHEQDVVACESVWRGLASRGSEPGPLSPLEASIWQFNQWWLARMLDAPA